VVERESLFFLLLRKDSEEEQQRECGKGILEQQGERGKGIELRLVEEAELRSCSLLPLLC
jgi:hypothetical protein